MSTTPLLRRTVRAALVPAATLLTLAGMGGAHAQAAPAFDEQQLRAFVSEQVGAASPSVTRFEVQIGKLHPDTVLAPCQRVQPFLPSHGRLWGRSSLGVRCAEGANWSVMLPITVTAWGQALVATAPMAAGQVVSAEDVREQEVELTRQAPGLATELAQLEGRTLTRSLLPGQPVRVDMVRTTPVVKAGDPVRLRIHGRGFTINAAGQAMAQAAEGQSIRVRTDMGKVLTGVARDGRIVDVAL